MLYIDKQNDDIVRNKGIASSKGLYMLEFSDRTVGESTISCPEPQHLDAVGNQEVRLVVEEEFQSGPGSLCDTVSWQSASGFISSNTMCE